MTQALAPRRSQSSRHSGTSPHPSVRQGIWQTCKAALALYLADGWGVTTAQPLANVTAFPDVPQLQGKYLNYVNGSRYPLLGFNNADARGCGVYDNHTEVSLDSQMKILDFVAVNFPKLKIQRKTMESDNVTGTSNDTVVTDPSYLSGLIQLADYWYEKHGGITEWTPWQDPTELTDGAVTNATVPTLQILATAAQSRPYVWIGLTNEVHPNAPSNATDAQVLARSQVAVNAIRAISPMTIVVVAQPRAWDDYVSPYFEDHPIIDPSNQTFYAVHMYDSGSQAIAAKLAAINASRHAILIEETGPTGESPEGEEKVPGGPTYADTCQTVNGAMKLEVPTLFWTFQPAKCHPSMTHSANSTAGAAAVNLTLNTYGWLVKNTSESGVCSYTPPQPTPLQHGHKTLSKPVIGGIAAGGGVVAVVVIAAILCR